MRYQYKTIPRSYQRRGLKKAVDAERAALWWPMRTGKTKTAIDWASVLHLKYGITRVLVLTHTITTFGVWRNEFAKHCPVPYVLGVRDAPEVRGRKGVLEVLVLNIQQVYGREGGRSWIPVDNKALIRWKPQAIIVDEATCVGDPGAVQTAHLYRLVQKVGVRFLLELTGTPVHRKVWGAFGQFKILDDSVFGTSIVAYREQFGVWGGYGRKKCLKLRNMKRWRRKVEPYVHQVYRIPSREPVHQIIPVELSSSTRELYEEMRKEGVIEVDGAEVTAELPITRALKLAQIAAGCVRDDTGTWHVVGTDLRDAFSDTVQSLADSEVKRLVVFARHIPELRRSALALKGAGYRTFLLHGKVSADDRERRIAAFHDPGAPRAFVSQVATGSMGIDLSAADTTLYYSLPTSILHKDQADARTRLHGEKRALTYYYFLPPGTVLEANYYALMAGMDLAQWVTRHPTLIHHTERE